MDRALVWSNRHTALPILISRIFLNIKGELFFDLRFLFDAKAFLLIMPLYQNFWLSQITWKVNEYIPCTLWKQLHMQTLAKTLPGLSWLIVKTTHESPPTALYSGNAQNTSVATLVHYSDVPRIIFLFILFHSWFHKEILFPEVELQFTVSFTYSPL